MEAITLFVIALLVWKVIELNEKIENLEISTRYQLEGVAALLANLQPKKPVEIPTRLDNELVEELLVTEQLKVDDDKKPLKIVKEYWDGYNTQNKTK